MSSTNKKINPAGLFKAKGFTQAVSSTGTETKQYSYLDNYRGMRKWNL